MIITGLNNKDLLGCTFDQIMNILKNANLPITFRLKSIDSQQKQHQQSNHLMIPTKHKYIHCKKQKHAQKQHKILLIETTNWHKVRYQCPNNIIFFRRKYATINSTQQLMR